MILDQLNQSHRYHGLSSRFAAAFEFLQKLPANAPDGRQDIDGDDCFALVQGYVTKPVAQAKFETHRRYIDIQFIQAGRETILWAPLTTLTEVTQPYAAEKDVSFYGTPAQVTPIQLCAGKFAIFFPEDGHAPCLELNGPAEVRKTVIKVRV